MEELNQPPRRANFFDRLMMFLTGVDEHTLVECPRHDWENVRAIGLLMVAVWICQTGLFSIVLHRIAGENGNVHPEFIAAAAFAATMILLIDSYMVMRSGWHLHGIGELKRGGIDISGGWGPSIRNGAFLALRILLSLGIAQLTAVFTSLIIFHADLVADTDLTYRNQNSDLIAVVQQKVDAEIKRASAAADSEAVNLQAVAAQVAAMRNGTIDPDSNNSSIISAAAEVTRLSADRDKREQELRSAQTFAANEIAGIRGDPGNTGKPGAGPVREGAQERVLSATANAEAATKAANAAQARLDALRQQMTASQPDRIRQAQAQLPALEAEFRDETQRLSQLRAQVADLTQHREEAIRTGVDAAPNHVGYDDGLLGQLVALQHIARDPQIAFVVALIDFVSFGLELAAVLAKVTSFVPTLYSALLARDAYLAAVGIAGQVEDELEKLQRRPVDTSDEGRSCHRR